MKILIVDDSNDKIAGILEVIKSNITKEIIVETVLDSISAQRKVENNHYDLLIVDLQLPLRPGNRPIKEGGKQLVYEIERKDNLKSPKYILGTSQYQDCLELFPAIWNTIHYNNSNEWKKKLVRLIKHIEKVEFKANDSVHISPTIYVEGLTDKDIFNTAVNLFKPHLKDKLIVKSDSNAGAKWVSNQIVAWAHSRVEGTNDNKKAIGILDGDQAGIDAKNEVDRIIKTDSAKRKYYKLILLSADFARGTIPIRAKGLKIPITLEELFPANIWKYAKSKDWLKERPPENIVLENPNDWNRRKESLDDYISKLDIPDSALIYLYTFKNGKKQKFVNYVCQLSKREKREVFTNFTSILDQIESFLI